MRVLSRLFRRLFLEMLDKALQSGKLRCFAELEPLQDRSCFRAFLEALAQTEWVVYAKSPFGGPAQVIEYLGRYTRVALSNERLLRSRTAQVQFQWKDYRLGHRPKSRRRRRSACCC